MVIMLQVLPVYVYINIYAHIYWCVLEKQKNLIFWNTKALLFKKQYSFKRQKLKLLEIYIFILIFCL